MKKDTLIALTVIAITLFYIYEIIIDFSRLKECKSKGGVYSGSSCFKSDSFKK